MIAVSLVPADRSQLPVFEELWQLYMYDFSEFLEVGDAAADVDEQGLYAYEFDFRRYWERMGYWAYLARLRERIAGFVLVSDRIRFRNGPGRYIDEFFVLRRYRRRGIGRALAFQTFDTYRGYWEIAEIPGNTPAQTFWRRVIGAYANGRFEETITPEREVWQHFDSSTW